MLVNLKDILENAQKDKKAVLGFNVFGYGWARACIEAAEEIPCSVIILVNRAFASYMPPRHLGNVLCKLAEDASVRVCIHLDHNNEYDIIKESLDSGFTSVMYDGSYDVLENNIEQTIKIVELAKLYNASVEGEIGTVKYIDVENTITEFTNPNEAYVYVDKTGIDALAISIGTIHRGLSNSAEIKYSLLKEIREKVCIPLVIHGATSIGKSDLLKLQKYGVAKFNMGTALRRSYANCLRQVIREDEAMFDKLELNQKPLQSVKDTAYDVLKLLYN